MQALVEAAPRLDACLGSESRAHFDGLRQYLDDAGIGFTVNPRLVRGLDYYNLTVFEWITTELGSQGTICGGGRYDGLIELFGGKPAPAVGFAIGVERLVELARGAAILAPAAACDVYVVHHGTAGNATTRLALRAAETLRSTGLDVIAHCGGGSFKSQMKKADASGAQIALIIGDDEVASGEVVLKAMRSQDAQQHVPLTALAERVIALIPAADI